MKRFFTPHGWVALCLLLVLGTVLAVTCPAKAYEPEKDYWFIERFTLGEVNLPDGVSINTSDSSTSPRDSLVIRNQTGEPLYVMSLNYKNVLVMATPDPYWKTRISLAHEAAAYLVLPERPAALSIEALADLDLNLVDANVLSFDQPPAGVAVPAAQRSELLLVYAGQVIEVPFSLTYTLNTAFDNGSEVFKAWYANVQATETASAMQTMVNEAARVRENAILLSLAALIGLAGGGWMIWRISHPHN